MLNNKTFASLLNMNNTDIFINPINLSLNLPNKEKNTNLQNYMTQFPRKEETQNINLMSNINPKRTHHVIGGKM